MKYIITGKNFTSPLLKQLQNKKGYLFFTEKKLSLSTLSFSCKDRIYAPDESSVPIILSKIQNKEKCSQIENIKNKYKCRLAMQKRYPTLYFKKIKLSELEYLKLPIGTKCIIKPQKGFFGVGVKEINSHSNLKQIRDELQFEINKNRQVFSDGVFSSEDFIVEEYIRGEEYAFDVFYNNVGIPTIVNFCHHPPSKIKDYFHLLYYTHKSIYDTFNKQVIQIFSDFNESRSIKNIPIHAEFRDVKGELIPIEWNIPRFGGFGVADLPYYGYGVNPFTCYFESKKPNWEKILINQGNKYYGWVLCYNGLGVDLNKHTPDYKLMKKDLGKVLHFYKLNYQKNPAFGIGYVKTNTKEDLFRLLDIDFKKYFSK